MPIEINGELIQDDEIRDILRMIDHECQEQAGIFFEEPLRSPKFRNTWKEVGALQGRDPQLCFVEHAWTHFHHHVRASFSRQLQPYIDDVLKIPNPGYEKNDYKRDRLFKALVMMNMISEAAGTKAQSPMQLEPGTQAFHGDKTENRHISEDFGDHADMTIH